MQSEFRSTSTQEMFLMFLCNLRSLVWGQFTVKNHSELLKVSCSCSKYLLLLFPPGPFVCVCLQELNATTRYSQRRRAQAEDTQVHKHTHNEIPRSSSLVFCKLPSHVLPLPHQSSRENDQSEAAEVPKDEADFKQVFNLELFTPSSDLLYKQCIKCLPLCLHVLCCRLIRQSYLACFAGAKKRRRLRSL